MAQDKLWILLGKQLSGEISEEERVLLHELIKEEDGDLSFFIELLEEDWKRGKKLNLKNHEQELNNHWAHLSDRLFDQEKNDFNAVNEEKEERSGRKKHRRWYVLAASILLLLGISIFYYYQGTSTVFPRGEKISVENGTKKKVILPDSTVVWLNAGSTLTYNGGFGKENRMVWLSGEGCFDVAKDASLPFKVYTSDITVKVLGTVFNIRAYQDESKVQTTLLSGKIQVLLDQKKGEKVVLFPKEKLTVHASNMHRAVDADVKYEEKKKKLPLIAHQPIQNKMKYQVSKLSLNSKDSSFFTETAWIENKVAFVNESFKEVAKKMDRKYDTHIIFKDQDLEKVVMTGIFKKEKIGEALQVLQLLTPFHYKIKQDSIYLFK